MLCVNSGPDLVVCDEGHVLKNDMTGLSKATNQVKSRRRIVLTGTPLQNNLIECECVIIIIYYAEYILSKQCPNGLL